MYVTAIALLLLGMLLTLVRALLGSTVYDRILAVNVFGTITVLFLAVHGFFRGRPDFLDLALVYALINFIGTVAILKFFEYGDMGRASSDEKKDV